MNILTIFPLLIFVTHETVSSDPCSNNEIISNAEKRSAGYPIDLSKDTPINDVFLSDGWYKVESSIESSMPREAPGPLKCGTWYPIWLNDSLPTVSEGIASKELCMQSFFEHCASSWNIEIKNCDDNFYVYNLVSSPVDKSAYCFGSQKIPCPDGESSETGFYPGCSADYPKMTIIPTVIVDLILGPLIRPEFVELSLQTAFSCQFNIAESEYYDVHWYINEQTVTTFKNVLIDNIEDTNLTESVWVGKYRLNMVVKCSVRLRNANGSTPGPEQTSAPYAAGLFPERYEYQVKEDETVQIKLQSTFPVGCMFGNSDEKRMGCAYTMHLSMPNYQIGNDEKQEKVCERNVEQLNLAIEQYSCHVSIPSIAWNEPIIINVTGYINGKYDYRDRISYLKIKHQIGNSPGIPNPWDDSEVPEIKILVTDEEHTMAGRTCVSYNDPHFATADRYYWNYYEPGEFILYRHKTLPYQVNVLFGKCNGGASCNCGIAIMSGASMFVVRTCDEITTTSTHTHPPLIEMRACDDTSMTIQENGNTYTVTLPIGTEIKFATTYYNWHGHSISYIQVKPSILDVENADGLCGRITKGKRNTADDFTLRNGTKLPLGYYNGYTFGRNWMVKNNESFFVDEPDFNKDVNLRQYCICYDEASLKDDPSLKVETFLCGLEAPLHKCLTQTAHAGNFHTTCTKLRRRRSLNGNGTVSATDSDDVIDNKQMFIEESDEMNREIPPETNSEWPTGWSKDLAQSECELRLKQDILEEALDAAHTSIDSYITTCMSDIQLAGDMRFLQDTISSVRETVLSEIVRNQSLFTSENTNDTTTESTKSIAEMLLSGLCSNNCSQNGKCQNGICKCDHGFGKQDCSEDLSTPPSNISIPLNGICNTRERLCAKTNIQGVFSSRNITCLSRHFQIMHDGSWKYTSSQHMYAAEYKNTYLVACDLPSSGRQKRSISTTVIADGFEINLSNDGTNFGEGVKIIIYDEDCYSCDIANLSCVSLDSCPNTLTSASQTSSTELEAGGSSPTSTNTVSNTTITAKTSTNMKTTTITSTSTPFTNNVNNSSNSIAIVGGCFGVLLFMVLAIGIFVFFKKHCKSNGHGIENIIHEYTDDVSKGNNKSTKTLNQYERENTNASVGNLSLDMETETDTYSRPRTPVQLFYAGK